MWRLDETNCECAVSPQGRILTLDLPCMSSINWILVGYTRFTEQDLAVPKLAFLDPTSAGQPAPHLGKARGECAGGELIRIAELAHQPRKASACPALRKYTGEPDMEGLGRTVL